MRLRVPKRTKLTANKCVDPSADSALSLPIKFLVCVSRRSALAHANR